MTLRLPDRWHRDLLRTLAPGDRRRGVLDRLVAAGMDCARAELLARHARRPAPARRATCARPPSAPGRADRAAARPAGAEAAARRATPSRAPCAARRHDRRSAAPARPAATERVARRVRRVRRARHGALADRHRRRRAALRRRADRRRRRHRARASSPGPLSPRKGINVTYARPELPAITDKDVADLALAAELGADFVALSFVRSAADIEQLRALLAEPARGARHRSRRSRRSRPTSTSTRSSPSTDGVMVARGDYGVEAGVARVPLMQKDTIQPRDAGRQARDHGDADARVDDPRARADARRGGRRRQRRDRRHVAR